MPLINLQTNLKSISYNGNGPYVQKDINNPGRPATDIIQSRVDDTTRMLRLLGEKGVAFTAKQALLLAGTKGLAAIPQAGNILLNIIAQVPVNGTGTHFLPISRNLYYTGVTDAAERSLQGGIIGGASREGRAFNTATRLLNQQSELGDIGENLTDNNVSQYLTVGQTTDISFQPNQEYVKPTPAVLTVQLNSQRKKGERPTPIVMGVFNDTETLDTKYGFAESGKSDRVNLLDIGQGDPSNDFVPVLFKLYGRPQDQNSRLLFRGFIANLSDTFNGTWNGVSYVGRMEQFFTYAGFTRNISFQLTVPIFSEAEQPIVYNKANSLASYTAPYYQPESNLPQGNILSMSIGNYIATNGILNSVGITVANEVPWSYSKEGEYLEGEARLLPQVLTLNITFTPIHRQAPALYTTSHIQGSSTTPYLNHSVK
jgi:hypothetical protein